MASSARISTSPTIPTRTWEQAEGPAFPAAANAAVERIWVVEPGVGDGVLWCGVAPAALFRSGDGGKSWALVEGLWNVPERPQWEPGAGGLCLHSICPWPGDPNRVAIGISSAGVWLTDDAGKSWRRSVGGLVPRYIPEEARKDTHAFCVHNMRRAPLQPATLYMQFHGGVYRSDDAGESWTDIGTDRGLPSDFGFPLAIDPNDPDRAFVVPLAADMDRVTPDGKVRVYETRDRGAQLARAARRACRSRRPISPCCARPSAPTGQARSASISGRTSARCSDRRTEAGPGRRWPPICRPSHRCGAREGK